MTVRTSYAHGTPSWVDLSTTDPDAAMEFYSGVFGWSFDRQPTSQGGEYIMADKGGHAAAGMMEQRPEQAEMGIPPMWNTYITVDDLDATLAAVPGAGGSVMMPAMDVESSGRMGVIVDPTGAVVSLWEAKDHIGAEVVNEHGALCWNEVQTPEVDAAVDFYGKLLGWGTQSMDMGEAGEYTVFTIGEDGIGGAMKPPADGIPPHWNVVFAVDDADACAATAKSSGGQVLMQPFDMPIGRSAVIADPQGAAFQVIALSDPPPN